MLIKEMDNNKNGKYQRDHDVAEVDFVISVTYFSSNLLFFYCYTFFFKEYACVC